MKTFAVLLCTTILLVLVVGETELLFVTQNSRIYQGTWTPSGLRIKGINLYAKKDEGYWISRRIKPINWEYDVCQITSPRFPGYWIACSRLRGRRLSGSGSG